MSKPAPVVYLLYGEDDVGIAAFLKTMQDKLGDPSTAEMNTTQLSSGARLEEIQAAAAAVPFLAPRRLVILEDYAKNLRAKDAQEAFTALLETIPATTAVVVIERREMKDSHWLLKWAKGQKDRVYLRSYSAPKGQQMVSWIRKQAADRGGEMSHLAATLLAENVQESPRMAVMEIEKLLAYVNYQRPIDVDDVEAASAFTSGQGDYFAYLNALALRNGRQAMKLLEALLEEREPIPLYFSVVGHFRLVLQTREIIEEGGQAQAVADALGISTFRAGKMIEQARVFSMQSLEKIYRRLHELDKQIKTGQIKTELALETLTLELTGSS